MNNTFNVIRTKRKTIGLSITKEGRLLVRAPLFVSEREIEKVVQKHQSWIEKNRLKMACMSAVKESFAYRDGQVLPVLGHAYPIMTGEGKKAVFTGEAFLLPMGNREKTVALWYKKQAKEILGARTDIYSRIMGLNPVEIKITSAKTRWGSCSAKNALCFSWRLLCAPPMSVDSVVVHELAHIKMKNHSKAFYREIEKVMPDYRTHHQILKEYARKIPF